MEHDSDSGTTESEAEQLDDEEVQLGAFDLDGDGKVSPVEDLRADLGLLDARLEQVADEGGAKGKLAEAAHHLVDRIDND